MTNETTDVLREEMAKRLFWADTKHRDKEQRILDEWRDSWWAQSAAMSLSGPGFVDQWFALADAALAATVDAEVLDRAQLIVAIANRQQGKAATDTVAVEAGVIRACAAVVNGARLAPLLSRMTGEPDTLGSHIGNGGTLDPLDPAFGGGVK